jgi:branched-chain amino acid transport system permease protein
MEYFLELFFSGLTRGSIYALIALGYTMVYGIIQLINFAHGEIYMIGTFTALIVSGVLGLLGFPSLAILVIAALIAVIYSSAYGFTVEKIAYKPLRNAPRLSALISAIGMSIFLQNYVLLAQTPDFMPFPDNLPTFGFMEPYRNIMSSSELAILLATAVIMVLLTLFIKFTRIGKAMRATAQNKKMAMLSGVNVDRVISMTFIIGSALAALGGSAHRFAHRPDQLLHRVHRGDQGLYSGRARGIGSIPGAVLGGLVLGWTESFATGYVSSDYEDVFAFALLVLILIFRPAGILGRSTTQKV